MSEKYDLIIVGAGPSGIFMAYELIKLGKNQNVLILEQGKQVDKRFCPIENGKCVKCKPLCNITSGFAGAGAFSDGKLSLYNNEDEDIYVGGYIHKYIGVEETKQLIDYTDKIYLEFGADKKLEGVEYKDEVKSLAQKAKENDINLISIPIRHLGTEKSHELYKHIQDYIIEKGINIKFETCVSDLIIENNTIKGVKVRSSQYVEDVDFVDDQTIYANKVILGVGRKGANWLANMCEKHSIQNKSGVIDIGVRYELPDEVMKDVNKYMYEGKFIAKPSPYKDKVRTFCQNPSGFVSSEVYDHKLTLVNGHSYKDRKSANTNLAILSSHRFTYPFNEPIKYGRNVAENTNQLGNGNVLVQRLGDILNGKRTWEHELKNNFVVPTLKSAVAGDITYSLGFRTMTNILGFIKTMNHVIPGFADSSNLLYAPEIKFYSNQVIIDNNFKTSVEGLYSIGDGGGLTRGLMMASCSGVQMARNICSNC